MENVIVIAVVGILLWIEWLLLRGVGGTRDTRPNLFAPGEDATLGGDPVDRATEDGMQIIDFYQDSRRTRGRS